MPKAINGIKTCSDCKVGKPISDFQHDRGTADGFDYTCRLCNSQRNRKRFLSKGKLIAEQVAKRRSLGIAFCDAAKADGCVDCGNKNLSVLDLDHVRGKKVISIAKMVGYSLKRLFAEIDKCETRCANCHRIVTRERRIAGKPARGRSWEQAMYKAAA